MSTSYERHAGGFLHIDPFQASIQLSARGARNIEVNPGVGDTGFSVKMPSALGLPLGGPHYYLANGGVENVDVEDFEGNSIYNPYMAGSQSLVIFLYDNTTVAGSWAVFKFPGAF